MVRLQVVHHEHVATMELGKQLLGQPDDETLAVRCLECSA
jgi:hypothetical protein